MKLVVTGAGGYIGRQIVMKAGELGHQVISASRRKTCDTWLPFDLANAAAFALPADVGAIIHLAAKTAQSDRLGEQDEVNAARVLIAKATSNGSRLVFVSSQAAREDAPTAYGRTKWKIERLVIAAGGVVVRPGQVYGADERGLFGTLVGLVRRLPLLPAFLPSPLIQPIHVGDLATGLLRVACDKQALPEVIQLGADQPVTFTCFLRHIGKARVRRWRLFVPVPVAMLALCRGLVGKRLWRGLGLERLVSLFALPRMATAADLELLQLNLRSLSAGMHRSGDGRRRAMLQEGRLLLCYLLKESPGMELQRRYVRAVETLRGGDPMRLPWWVKRRPVLLALLDDPQRLIARMPELSTRLDIALLLAEASRQGAGRFLPDQIRPRRMAGAFSIFVAVCSEAFWRVCRVLYVACAPITSSGKGTSL